MIYMLFWLKHIHIMSLSVFWYSFIDASIFLVLNFPNHTLSLVPIVCSDQLLSSTSSKLFYILLYLLAGRK